MRKAYEKLKKILGQESEDPVSQHVNGVDETTNLNEKKEQRAVENSLTIPRERAKAEKEERERTEGRTISPIPGVKLILPPKKKDKDK